MTPTARLAIAAPVAAGMTWWTGPRDLPDMELGTTLAVFGMLLAAVFGFVSIVTEVDD
jgi:hypothetical protein